MATDMAKTHKKSEASCHLTIRGMKQLAISVEQMINIKTKNKLFYKKKKKPNMHTS